MGRRISGFSADSREDRRGWSGDKSVGEMNFLRLDGEFVDSESMHMR